MAEDTSSEDSTDGAAVPAEPTAKELGHRNARLGESLSEYMKRVRANMAKAQAASGARGCHRRQVSSAEGVSTGPATIPCFAGEPSDGSCSSIEGRWRDG